ncbi:hypothetical protein Q31b_47230 [Novipirellula aureliae]|uniref:Tyr recombinase domain-containing protein n=1 Tax=Novipirellula aureliae TaxID=2527966 RepID=A0A5C6DNZ6_9BACT|nr:tyrosine-type recombinase/integrase [Novipirellula aureliae]TWU37934.1 hypothetical protein Q31b_47230 [Novipirellula aureliae]
MPRKRKLTFQKGTRGRKGRWKKIYKGTNYYLGQGKSQSDIEGYQAALARWEEIKAQLDSRASVAEPPKQKVYDDTIREWELVLAWSVQYAHDDTAEEARSKIADLRSRRDLKKPPPIEEEDRFFGWTESLYCFQHELLNEAKVSLARQVPEELAEAFKTSFKSYGPLPLTPVADDRFYENLFRDEEVRWKDRIENQKKLMGALESNTLEFWVQSYITKQHQRVDAKALSAGRYSSIKAALDRFQSWAGGQSAVDTICARTLTQFHSHLLQLISKDQCAPAYARDIVTVVRSLVRWLWEQDAIENLPKNIDSTELRICRKSTTPQTFEIDEVMTLLQTTSDRSRLYVLLALNCGMTQKDISDLCSEDINWQARTITRKRSKTQHHESVPTVTYRLWPETLSLLLQERGTNPEILLPNRNGNRLLSMVIRPNGTYSKTDNIKNAYERALRRMPFKKPFKLLRKTSATLISADKRFRGLDQLFLGHAPSTVAERHYVAIDKNALNEALSYLREKYKIASIDTDK